MLARAATWWTILRISLEERLVYRGDFALGTLMRFLPIVTQIFLWGAVFAANGNRPVAGKYRYEDMVAYYLLTMVARAFSSMPGLASNIALDIRTGGVKKYLIQPIDMIGFLLAGRVAHKLVYYAVATGPFALVFWLCRGYFPGWPDADVLAIFVASIVLSFLLGFFLEAAIGMVGFWFLEVSSLLFIYMLFSFFLSGHMFPLEMLQGQWSVWTTLMPLQYLAYFPAAVFLGIIPREQAYWGLAMELVWVVLFAVACRTAYAAGLRGDTAPLEADAMTTTGPAAPPGDAATPRDVHPSYVRVFLTFARNSLVRHMTFRANFLVEAGTSLVWMLMNLGFYLLIFQQTPSLGQGTGWGKYEFFVFLSTTLLISSFVQALFMPNVDEFGELIRSGGLDFALLKPIDTQFLVSLQKIDWSVLSNVLFAAVLLGYSLAQLDQLPGVAQWLLYPLYVACGVSILYSLMISLAALSVWMGRNQSLYDFWFYITTFSRYPMEIYEGPVGRPLRWAFSFVIPILIVVNVPASLLAKPLSAQNWPLAIFALVATAVCLTGSRWMFRRALESYRSASS